MCTRGTLRMLLLYLTSVLGQKKKNQGHKGLGEYGAGCWAAVVCFELSCIFLPSNISSTPAGTQVLLVD
jgi:hypothetical protein